MAEETLQSTFKIAENLMKEFVKNDFLIDADNEDCVMRICDKKHSMDPCRIVIDLDFSEVRITLENQTDESLNCRDKIFTRWQGGCEDFLGFFHMNKKNALERIMKPGGVYLDVEGTVSRFIKAYNIVVSK